METQEKYNLPFPSTLRKLLDERGTTITALARELGISRQAVSQYADGTGQPNVDKLTAIADYFNVSADFLIGRTKVQSTEIDERAACEYTGLSKDSVEQLHKVVVIYKQLGRDGGCQAAETINALLEDNRNENIDGGSRHYRSILGLIRFFLEYKNKSDHNTLIYSNGDAMQVGKKNGFSANAIMLDARMIENAALLEIQRALINLKKGKNQGAAENGGVQHG